MTRQEAIDRWKGIAETVFCAEAAIAKEWNKRLRDAAKLPEQQRRELANAYVEAIATEIVSKTTDEELASME